MSSKGQGSELERHQMVNVESLREGTLSEDGE